MPFNVYFTVQNTSFEMLRRIKFFVRRLMIYVVQILFKNNNANRYSNITCALYHDDVSSPTCSGSPYGRLCTHTDSRRYVLSFGVPSVVSSLTQKTYSPHNRIYDLVHHAFADVVLDPISVRTICHSLHACICG